MNLRTKKTIRESKSDKIFTFMNYFLLTMALIIFGYPLIFIVSASFSSGRALMTNSVWLWPVEFTLEGYQAVFAYRMIISAFRNSFVYMIVGTAINLLMTILAAYPLSRKDFYGGKIIAMIFVFTMFFNSGLIPTFILVNNLGMRNTIWAMVIPNALSVWNVIITRTFFKSTIPESLSEAAQLDGCNDFKFVLLVVLPLSKAIIAVMTLFYAVAHWNSFFNALLFLSQQELFPLQIILRQILIQNEIDFSMIAAGAIDVQTEAVRIHIRELLRYSVIVVSSVPFLILYPFIQRHFVKGVMIGSLKG